MLRELAAAGEYNATDQPSVRSNTYAFLVKWRGERKQRHTIIGKVTDDLQPRKFARYRLTSSRCIIEGVCTQIFSPSITEPNNRSRGNTELRKAVSSEL
jgi:hypothetical protein